MLCLTCLGSIRIMEPSESSSLSSAWLGSVESSGSSSMSSSAFDRRSGILGARDTNGEENVCSTASKSSPSLVVLAGRVENLGAWRN